MVNEAPLTLLENFLLLALNEETGQLHSVGSDALDYATAGAILMDLTLRNRIDNDMRDLFPIDPTPTGDDILDPVMQMISLAPVLMPHPIVYWLKQIAEEGASLRKKALRRLEKRGIIRNKSMNSFWMLGFRGGSTVNEQEQNAVKARLMGTLHGGDVPTAQGIMLTGLVYACGLFPFIMNETEYKDASARIEKISHMDLICQAVAKSIAEAHPTLSVVSGN
ncbi:MAG: GPP34 family phosphoprotein [Bdellovibrionales bacterium]